MMENPPMNENESVSMFTYPSETVAVYCSERLMCIHMLKQETVCNLARIGGLLEEVKAALPHGQFGPWLATHWGGSEDSARRYRLLYKALPKIPQIAEFESVTAATEFVTLEPWQQEAVLGRRAFRWNEFRQAVWDVTTRHHLADNGIDEDRRYGDVLHAIEEAKDDPVLADKAAALYEENRETFARLEGEDPAVVDVEVGIQWKEPDGTRPRTQLVDGENGYWLCRWDGEQMVPVAPVQSHVLMWNGGNSPIVLAAFPKMNDGPGAASWQRAGVNAFADRLNATTLATVYGGQVL